jgi:hypothetical protein
VGRLRLGASALECAQPYSTKRASIAAIGMSAGSITVVRMTRSIDEAVLTRSTIFMRAFW